MSRLFDDKKIEDQLQQVESTRSAKMIDRIGGKEVVAKVHKIFYDKIFAHPWLSLYFNNIDQSHLENQQTDFMSMLFGGERVYGGRMPADAHEHIFVSEEMFVIRHGLLEKSLIQAGIADEERRDWLRIDSAFKAVVVKASRDECSKRYATDEILDFPDPTKLKNAS